MASVTVRDLVQALTWHETSLDILERLIASRRATVQSWIDEYCTTLGVATPLSSAARYGKPDVSNVLDSPFVWSKLRMARSNRDTGNGPIALIASQIIDAGLWHTRLQTMANREFEWVYENRPVVNSWSVDAKYALVSEPNGEEAIYCAPLVASDIVVDLFSPFTRGSLPEIDGSCEDSIRREDAQRAVHLARSALEYIERMSHTCSRYVTSLTKVICLRTDINRPGLGSASTPLCHSRPVLFNCHTQNVAMESVADLLVHEAVHGVFDIVELLSPVCTSTSARANSMRITTSAWTGRPLAPDTFVQACFVWYALFFFWLGVAERACTELALRHLAQAAGGFMRGDLRNFAGAGAEIVHEDALEAIVIAQENVLSHV